MLMKYLSIKRLTWLCIAALSTPVFTSCDMMTEDRDDCPMGLYLNFKYDYNLERADMFNGPCGSCRCLRVRRKRQVCHTPVGGQRGQLAAAGRAYILNEDGPRPGQV